MSEQQTKDKYDHTFKAIHDHEVEWESDDVRGLLTLPEGVQVKVLNYDPEMKRLDMKQRFPAGYVEPRHTHESWHSILVLSGRMCVAGKDLRAGDYLRHKRRRYRIADVRTYRENFTERVRKSPGDGYVVRGAERCRRRDDCTGRFVSDNVR